jgi:hypothetical protein
LRRLRTTSAVPSIGATLARADRPGDGGRRPAGDLLPVSNGPSVALDAQLMIVEDATIVDTAAVSQLVR